MHRIIVRPLLLLLLLSLFSACANIIPPTGGPRDAKAPRLLSIKPKDSLLNTRVTRIEMKFDEFITVSDVSRELHISPALTQSLSMTGSGKSVQIKIPDSLLQDNTTYRISFGKAIKDLHESNPYDGRAFTFSTGPWFDSLKMKGIIYDAASGQLDSSGLVKVLLYNANFPYDIVLRQKPAYVTTSNTKGEFLFQGLPNKNFRIFAIKENTENLQFDNDEELIGFADTTFNPATDTLPIILKIFKELPDSSRVKIETAAETKRGSGVRMGGTKATTASNANIPDSKNLTYKVSADTSNIEKRTQEITLPIEIFVSRKIQTLNDSRIVLSADSNGVETETKFIATTDTGKQKITITTQWQQNTLYTLRLLKSFIIDTSNTEAMPSKYIFRTKSDEDYGKIEINIPEKYVGKPYLLQVNRDADSVYLKPVTAGKISLKLLAPGTYKMTIIEDKNNDGIWTSGELKSKRHAENAIPFPNTVLMKAGWENIVDFEPKKK